MSREPRSNDSSRSPHLRVWGPRGTGRVQQTGCECSTGRAGGRVESEEAPPGVRNGALQDHRPPVTGRAASPAGSGLGCCLGGGAGGPGRACPWGRCDPDTAAQEKHTLCFQTQQEQQTRRRDNTSTCRACAPDEEELTPLCSLAWCSLQPGRTPTLVARSSPPCLRQGRDSPPAGA